MMGKQRHWVIVRWKQRHWVIVRGKQRHWVIVRWKQTLGHHEGETDIGSS